MIPARPTLLLLALCLALACSSSPSSAPPDAADSTAEPTDLTADAPSPTDLGTEASETDAAGRPDTPTLHLLAPTTIPPGISFPVAVGVTMGGEPGWHTYGTVELDITGQKPRSIRLTRGKGSTSVTLDDETEATLTARLGELEASLTVQVGGLPERTLAGTLAGDGLAWGPDEAIHATGDLTVPAGKTLTILPGTVVLLDSKVNLHAQGDVSCTGTAERPVLFTAAGSKPWGGAVHDGLGEYAYTLFTHGGGDGSKVFGHSGSQAVLYVEGGTLRLDHAVLADNPGKGLGSTEAVVEVVDSLATRCDTGGELKKSLVTLSRTWFLEMPSDDGIPVDDDNDGIYLHNPHPDTKADEPSATVDHCVFAIGKDDGIDHNGSRIRVRNSFIEDFHHEGIACSKDNWVEVFDTLVMGCEQGIESGYGSPAVRVDHCTLTGNDVG